MSQLLSIFLSYLTTRINDKIFVLQSSLTINLQSFPLHQAAQRYSQLNRTPLSKLNATEQIRIIFQVSHHFLFERHALALKLRENISKVYSLGLEVIQKLLQRSQQYVTVSILLYLLSHLFEAVIDKFAVHLCELSLVLG